MRKAALETCINLPKVNINSLMSNGPPTPLFPAFAALSKQPAKKPAPLFPIFAAGVTPKNVPAPAPATTDNTWLKNTSFKSFDSGRNIVTIDSSDDSDYKRRRRHERRERKREREVIEKDEFGRDVKRDKKDKKDKKDKDKKKKKKEKSGRSREGARESLLLLTQKDSGYMDAKMRTKEYYFDGKGDKDNYQYGYLYSGDKSKFDRLSFCLGLPSPFLVGFPKDGGFYFFNKHTQDFENSVRYYVNALRDRKAKTINLAHVKREEIELNANFIPLEEEPAEQEEVEEGESQEESLHRRAREFNRLTQQNPHNVATWKKFAEFQDEYLAFFRNKRKKTLVLEKKMSIYQKALVANPNSEELTLGYLSAAEQLWDFIDSVTRTSRVSDLWQRVLRAFTMANKEGVSERMWRAYLTFLRSDFSSFSVSNVRSMYTSAITRLLVKRKSVPKGSTYEASVESIEHTLLATIIGWLRLEQQAGYTEKAIGIFQAFIEFNLFMAPHIATQSPSSQLILFEHFWESETPRIGDQGSQTWLGWLMNGGDQQEGGGNEGMERESEREENEGDGKFKNPIAAPSDDLVEIEEIDLNALPDDEAEEEIKEEHVDTEEESREEQSARVVMAYYEWAQTELKKEDQYWLPARPLVNVGGSVDDPERVVLYTDFKDVLFRFHSEAIRLELLLQFLYFVDPHIKNISLPLSSPTASLSRSLSTSTPSYTPPPVFPQYCTNHPFEKQEVAETEEMGDLFVFLSDDSDKDVEEVKIKKEEEGPKIKQEMKTEEEARAVSATIKQENKLEISKDKRDFIRKVFSIGLSAFPGNVALASAQLAFEFTYSTDEARKVAKELLQANRTSLPLCCAFAGLELSAGNLASSIKVFEATLSNYEKLPVIQQQACTQLFRTYAELELVVAREDLAALHILVGFTEGKLTPIPRTKGKAKLEPVAPTRLLKARNVFKQKFNELQKETQHTEGLTVSWGVHMVVMYALFEYLTGGGINAACRVFDEALEEFASDTLDHEQLLVSYVSMIYHHVSTTPSPPGLLRTVLFQAMDQYPNNKLFLSLFIRSESRSSMANRQRRYFDDACERYPSPVLWLFAIKTEIKKLGSSNRVKSLFEKAVENSVTRNSIAIWREYISWLIGTGDQRGAKQVFYRAIRYLPWAKKIWLDSMSRDLRHLFTKGELTDIYQLLTEKEVRVRVDLLAGE